MISRRSLLGMAAGGLLSGAAPARRPNFLVILADDLGFSDAGCYGGEIGTPNIDGLAAGGVRFTQGYSTARCVPSRAAILTGCYAQQINMDGGGGKMPSWVRFLPQYLKPLGYRSYHSGKWQIAAYPPVRVAGFDHSYAVMNQNQYFARRNIWLDDKPQPQEKESPGYYATTDIADRAIGLLKGHQSEHAAEPFFLYLAFTSPHFPLHALPEDIARFDGKYDEGWDVVRERRWRGLRRMGIVNCPLSPLQPDYRPAWNFTEAQLNDQIGPGQIDSAIPWNRLTRKQRTFQAKKMSIHAAMVNRMDRELGRVLDQVRSMGSFADTFILFISDNGASSEQIIRADGHDQSASPGSARTHLGLGPGWASAANSPFRLHKHWIHEGGVSSPWIVHWPNGIGDRGKLRHNPAHFVDILPTLADLAGGKPPALAGRSLAPVFRKDGTVPHDFIFFHHMYNRGLRSGDWKLVSAGPDGLWELYDLRKDRSEIHNLAARQPGKLKELIDLWTRKEAEFLLQSRQERPPGLSALLPPAATPRWRPAAP